MIGLLLTYKYLILIPLSIIEGPIVAIICGFLVTQNVLNPFLVYLIIVLGDILGDTIIYYVGYFGKRFLRHLNITEEKLEKAKQYFRNNHRKAILTSKLVHGIGFTGLIAAGASHVPFHRYVSTSTVISLVQSAVLILVGIVFGHTYAIIGKYLNYYAAGISVIVLIIALIIFLRIYKKI
jgi:membrane protein DedA with SNARE-associated domain